MTPEQRERKRQSDRRYRAQRRERERAGREGRVRSRNKRTYNDEELLAMAGNVAPAKRPAQEVGRQKRPQRSKQEPRTASSILARISRVSSRPMPTELGWRP